MSLRLKYGPHAGEAAARVLLREPQYCLWWLADRPESALSEIFRGLITRFDERPMVRPCSACGRLSHQAHAAAGGVELVAYCRPCGAGRHVQAPGSLVRTYEDAVRHVVETCPRAHRILLRRILLQLLGLKGGPSRLTEPAMDRWLHAPQGR